MKLERDMLEQYLDGELAPAQVAQVDQALSADPAAARLLARLRQERALRQAALRTYEPSAQETGALAQSMLHALAEQEHAPLAKIGTARWVRWTGAVAASLLLLAGGFYAGRTSTPSVVQAKPEYHVIAIDLAGHPVEYKFASMDEAVKFAQDTQRTEVASTADSTIMF